MSVHGLAEFIRRRAVFARRFYEYNPFNYTPYECHHPVRVAFTYMRNRSRFAAVAPPYGIVQVDPVSIQLGLGGPPRSWPLGSIVDGDWDLDHRRPVDVAFKLASMRQRFVLGFEWEETDLFQKFYLPKLERRQAPKDIKSIDELAAHYRRVYDPLYERIRRDGFLTPSLENPDVSFLYVHVARNGEFMFTIGGNHRLGMALALGLCSIPIRVVARHLQWQLVREDVKRGVHPADVDLAHPDLQDLVRHTP